MSKLVFGTGGRFGRLSKSLAYELVTFALSKGISHYDTGFYYCNGKSQPLLFHCLAQQSHIPLDRLTISTKLPVPTDVQDMEPMLVSCLEYLPGRDCIDVLFLWGPTVLDLQKEGLIQELLRLTRIGIIKRFGVNTHDTHTIEHICNNNNGYRFQDLMIDFNLLQKDRAISIEFLRKSGLDIWGGTALCQGLLLDSPLEIYARTRSISYLARAFLNPATRRLLRPSANVRAFIRSNFSDYSRDIPLSFVLKNTNISHVPIGMLSRSSIIRNLETEKNPVPDSVIQAVSKYANRFQL
jgi:aryl-alcohol dehydrogenase-like predicted oxidoreductase